jgi:pilus assembly protein CpaE
MGDLHMPRVSLHDAVLRNSSQILVVASSAYLEAFTNASTDQLLPGLKIAPHASGDEVADALLRHVSLLIIEVEPNDRASIRRIDSIRQRHPDLALVAAINGSSVSLVRTLVRDGINDVVELPFDIPDLLQISLDVLARHKTSSAQPVKLAPMVAVARSIGGCGATSFATHLAGDLAAHDASGNGVIIVDLDLQFGSVADYLGIRARGNIADLLGAHERLDEELVRSVTSQTPGGISVIAAPEVIMPLESVDTDDLLRLLKLLRQQYSYVILDLPANWTNWTLSASLTADVIVLVVELNLGSLRQAKRRLELFRSVGIEDGAIEIVVNRVEKRLFRTIDPGDVSQTLGHSVLGTIALDAPTVSAAQNQGVLVGDVQRKSKFVTDMARIGKLLRDLHLARGRG